MELKSRELARQWKLSEREAEAFVGQGTKMFDSAFDKNLLPKGHKEPAKQHFFKAVEKTALAAMYGRGQRKSVAEGRRILLAELGKKKWNLSRRQIDAVGRHVNDYLGKIHNIWVGKQPPQVNF